MGNGRRHFPPIYGQAKDWKPHLKVDIGRPKDGDSTEFLIGNHEIIIADKERNCYRLAIKTKNQGHKGFI